MNGFHFAGMPGGRGVVEGGRKGAGPRTAPLVKGKLCRQQKPVADWEGRCRICDTRRPTGGAQTLHSPF